jgi:5,10-methylenetetrahydromethanopterin reductase
MRVGVLVGTALPYGGGLQQLIADAQRAERHGLHAVWIVHGHGLDALTAAAILGQETRRIGIGTAVVPTCARHPIAMAQQALTVQAATAGRFVLGIGVSHADNVQGRYGLSYARPLSHMREYLGVLAPLVRGGSCAFAGSQYRVNAAVQVAGANPCPILLAALAPKMLALAGSAGEGTIAWMTGPKTLRDYTIPRIREAAATAGRPLPRVVAGFPVAVATDVGRARQLAAEAFQVYGTKPAYRAMLEREGAAGPADIAVLGDEDGIGEALEHLAELGVTDLLAAPFAIDAQGETSLERTFEALGRWAVRST